MKQKKDYSYLKELFGDLSYAEQIEKIALVTLMGRPKLAEELKGMMSMNKQIASKAVANLMRAPTWNMRVDLEHYVGDTESAKA